MNKILLSLLFALFYTLIPLKADEMLEITLATETLALPLGFVTSENLSPQAEVLISTLKNDLTLSGWFQVIQPRLKISEINPNQPFAHPRLRSSSQMKYLLTLEQNVDKWIISVFDIQKKAHLRIPFISDSWIQDPRQSAHLLSNQIVKAIVNQPGIAQSKILYTVCGPAFAKGEHSTQVWLADYDGHNAKKIFESNSLIVSPSFIPKRGFYEFCYVSYKLGQPKLMWAQSSGNSRRVTALGGNQLSPSFDSKGLQLAFVSDVSGNPDIYLMRLDPKLASAQPPTKLFSCSKATQASPTFSPDNKQMALVSSKDGCPRIYIITIEDFLNGEKIEKARLISKKNRENTAPTWSPDGKLIAYSARSQGPRQLWVYDIENQKEICLTQGEGAKENPSWALDSFHLYYDQTDATGTHVYMIDLNEQRPVKIPLKGKSPRFPCCSK